MTNTYGAAWEVPNAPSYPISLEVTSGSQTVRTLLQAWHGLHSMPLTCAETESLCFVTRNSQLAASQLHGLTSGLNLTRSVHFVLRPTSRFEGCACEC